MSADCRQHAARVGRYCVFPLIAARFASSVEGRRTVLAFTAGAVNARFMLVMPLLFLHDKSNGIADGAFGGMIGHRGWSFDFRQAEGGPGWKATQA
jgi:hypothetical protein